MEAHERDTRLAVEMCDDLLTGKDPDLIFTGDRNIDSSEEQRVVPVELQLQDNDVVKFCAMFSDEPSREDIVIRRIETISDGINRKNEEEEEEEKSTDEKEPMENSTVDIFTTLPPPPPPFSASLHPLNSFADDNSSQFAVQRSNFCGENRHRTTDGCNWRNSFYIRLTLEYIACSTVLAIVIPVLGIPAVVYSIRSYRAYKRGGLQQSRRLNLLAFRLILVAGALLCCLAMTCGFLTAYLLARPIQIVPAESPPAAEFKSAFRKSAISLFEVQGRELLDGRYNVSVLCQSRSRCDSSHASIAPDQTALPVVDPRWNPPESLATLVKRAEVKVLKSPVVPKPTRGSV